MLHYSYLELEARCGNLLYPILLSLTNFSSILMTRLIRKE
ncbi:hypothetical protein T06_1589 [Trichinella sp. T6]|nr:hypothetical protein T06_1589 [Trichinella sp. T6]